MQLRAEAHRTKKTCSLAGCRWRCAAPARPLPGAPCPQPSACRSRCAVLSAAHLLSQYGEVVDVHLVRDKKTGG